MILNKAACRALVLCTMVGLPSCSGDPGIPNDPPALDGVIVALAGNSVHVKHEPNEQCGVVFRVDARTSLLKRTATGSIVQASLDDMIVGGDVRVWAGAIAESCPGQALATTIELLP